jgi:hypothetical protein
VTDRFRSPLTGFKKTLRAGHIPLLSEEAITIPNTAPLICFEQTIHFCIGFLLKWTFGGALCRVT